MDSPNLTGNTTKNTEGIVDNVDTAITGFNSLGGAFLYGPASHAIGSVQNVPGGIAGRAINVTTSLTGVGSSRTLTIDWFTSDGGALIRPGDTIGGAAITQIQYEFGRANAGIDFFDIPGFAGFKHPADPTPGSTAFLADFLLLDTSGATLFAGNYFVFDEAGAGFSGIVNIGAGGADLGGFGIGGGRATINFNIGAIPTPGALALFGLAGLAGVRRRR